MKAKIESNRRSTRTQHTNQYVLLIDGVKSKSEVNNVLGKKVVWTTATGSKIIGKITKAHGNKGAVIATFEKGLPGQAIGTEVDLI